MLELSNVTFLYAPEKGLSEASLKASAGEVIGVVGGNGAGKSTLLGLIAGALVPQVGHIGLTVTDLHGRTKRFDSATGVGYRRHVGYLTERSPVFLEMSVGRYLRFRARLRGERFLRIRRRVNEAMERCGLQDLRKERLGTFSHGLIRRVALAEALLTLPQILVLDDPFSGIDAAMRASFIRVIQDVSQRSHVFISGHDPEMLAACCTRFAWVDHARLVADRLTFDEVLERLSPSPKVLP
ncbi:MAG: ABC transporter ATP-binding protein [Kiritimatiellia bacterium]